MKFEIEGTDMKRKIATRTGTAAHVFVPKHWAGKDVVAILVK